MAKKTALAKSSDAGEFEWNPEREKCLNLILAGVPKTVIAKELGVHRNTVNRWTANTEFISRLRQEYNEHIGVTRQRRLMETNKLNNRVSRLANKAVDRLEDLEQQVADGEAVPAHKVVAARQSMREHFHEYRAFREEERKDFGDDVKRIETRGTMHISGDVQVNHGTNDTAFSEFLADSLDSGVIDAKVLGEVDLSKVLPKAVEHVLIETDILDIIDEEDMALEE